MIGYVTWSSMMSGLRSQRERMMTWVSLRSGVASSGRCIIDHVPQIEAAATNAKIRNLFRTEKPIIRLIILVPRSGIGCGLHFVIQIFRGLRLELVTALIRAENKGFAVVRLRVPARDCLIPIDGHSTNGVMHHFGVRHAGVLHFVFDVG